MQPLFTYNVIPKLPQELEPLREIVFNLWWTWEPAARKLFRHLDPDLWTRTNHNPLRMLQLSRQARLVEVAANAEFMRELKVVHKKFKGYMARTDTYGKTRPNGRVSIAYFSAEFGFHESVPNYSGGLGILSGDHCKSASDLDLNFSAVTLLYRHGYFKQQINKEGWQESVSLNQNFHHLPIEEVRKDDKPLLISVDLLGRNVFARGLEARHRPHQPLPARHRHPREQRGRPAHHRPALRRRPGDAHPAGGRPRHRRRPGSARDGHRRRRCTT